MKEGGSCGSSDMDTRYPRLEEAAAAGPDALGPGVLERAQGCLLGQLAGDSLGSLVEFESAAAIRRLYPEGISHLADGGTFNTLAGQPTDDSEMALLLARSIVRAGGYDRAEAAVAYALWFDTPPFDYGMTTARALRPAVAALGRGGAPGDVAAAALAAADPASQANGALMRVSPLAIFAHGRTPAAAVELARADAALTHANSVCGDANAVFVVAIAHAIHTGTGPRETYEVARSWAASGGTGPEVLHCLDVAARETPTDFQSHQGWVLLALQNAFFQLLHAPSLEAGVCDTVMRGGDTDTNAAIAGALLGAVHGIAAIPDQWRDAVLACRPGAGRPGVHRPRPRALWPVDALALARRLAELGG